MSLSSYLRGFGDENNIEFIVNEDGLACWNSIVYDDDFVTRVGRA